MREKVTPGKVIINKLSIMIGESLPLFYQTLLAGGGIVRDNLTDYAVNNSTTINSALNEGASRGDNPIFAYFILFACSAALVGLIYQKSSGETEYPSCYHPDED